MTEPQTSTPHSTLGGGAPLARLRAFFDAAIELPPGARAEWLERNVADAADREALARILAAADESDLGFLDIPAAAHAGKLDAADAILADNLVGQRIGAFRLVRLIGKGGMAAVFLGEREGADFRQRAAIKLLRRGLYSDVEQRLFLRERQVLASLSHPNIARLFDGGLTDAGVPYLVMEFVDGTTITRHATERSLGLRARLDLFLVVCRAVEAAHRALIVHRDIKPANILVDRDGTVKLLDFGIAKLLEDNVESSTIGIFTPDYAAPEQLAAQPVTTATDVFGLGVLLHELLIGRRPSGATRRPSTLVTADTDTGAAAAGTNVTPADLRRRLKGDLDNILLKALAAEPSRRYASAGAFADDIERHLEGRPVAAHPPSRGYRARKFIARHKASVIGGSAFVVALLAALGVALWQAGVAREQARVAHEEAQRADAVQSFLVGVFDSNSNYQDDPKKARATTAQQLLDIGTQKIDGAMGDAPDAKLRMLELLAGLNDGLGLDEASLSLRRKAVALSRDVHGDHGIATFEPDMRLADALHSANSDEEAKALLEHAEATLDAHHDTDAFRRALLYDQLGEFYATRDAARAMDESRKSVALYETLPPSADFAFALSRKARAEHQAGHDEDAMASYRRAIDVSTAVDGQNSPDLPRYYAELAELQTTHHDIAGGEASARKALAAAKAIHGENHIDVAQCEVRLGRLLFDSDRTQEGFALIDDARAKTLALRGPDDGFHLPLMLSQYALAVFRLGHIEDASAPIDRAIAIRRASRPGTVPLAQFLEISAAIRTELGAFEEAKAALDEAGAIRSKVGQKAPSDLVDNNVVARIRLALAQNDVAQAKALVPTLAASQPDAEALDRQTLLGRLSASDVAIADGRFADAIATARDVRSKIETGPLAPYYGWVAGRADFVEGVATLHNGDAKRALDLLMRARDVRVRELDPSSVLLADVDLSIAEAQLADGDAASARESVAAAERIEAGHRVLGPHYRDALSAMQERVCGAGRCSR